MADNLPDNPEDRDDSQEGAGQPRPRLYAGKYRSPEDLERGYAESSLETQRIIMEKRALELELEALRRQAPPQEPEPDYLPVDSEGVPRAQIQRMVQETAQRVLSDTLSPLLKGMEARQHMEERYPDYGKMEPDIRRTVMSDPQLKQIHDDIARTSPLGAMEFAYAQFQARQAQQQAESQQAQEQVTHTRNQARITAPRTDGGRQTEQFDPRVYKQLLDKAQETGNWDQFLDYRFKGLLPDWQFNPEQAPWTGRR